MEDIFDVRTDNTSFLERLKICFHVLTKRSYIYFGMSKDPCEFDSNGKYLRLKKNSVSCYIGVEDEEDYNISVDKLFMSTASKYLQGLLKEYSNEETNKESEK